MDERNRLFAKRLKPGLLMPEPAAGLTAGPLHQTITRLHHQR
jgi:hypothetical protein